MIDFHYITYFLNGLLMIVMPISLTIYLIRKFKLGWRLFWIGAATFLFSQLLHIPFNAFVTPLLNNSSISGLPVLEQILVSALFLGLSAGIFEEFSRYFMYRWMAKDARSWGTGVLTGAGHGGIEAIVLGILVLYGYLQFITLRTADLITIFPAAQVEIARTQISAYWSAPWYMTMLGAVERLFTLPLHLACSLLVLQAFTRKRFWWVGLAISFHALADGLAVVAKGLKVPDLAIEGIIGIIAVISVVIILSLRQPEPLVELPTHGTIVPPPFTPGVVEETEENLDKTRYQ
jgi:uncharacterized membrane protein YhfC